MINVDIQNIHMLKNAEINGFYVTSLELVALKLIDMDKEFWKLAEARKYPILKNCVLKLKSFFRST